MIHNIEFKAFALEQEKSDEACQNEKSEDKSDEAQNVWQKLVEDDAVQKDMVSVPVSTEDSTKKRKMVKVVRVLIEMGKVYQENSSES